MPDQHSDSPQGPGEQSNHGPESPTSVSLLQQILSRLQQMEGGLSQHEQWLRRIEHESRTGPAPGIGDTPQAARPVPDIGPAELRRLVGELTLERDRAQRSLGEAHTQLGQYQQELLAFRKQVTELQNRVLEREGQLASTKEELDKHRRQVGTLQSEASRQIKHRQDQLQALQTRLGSLEQQRTGREQELQAALDEAAIKLQTLATTIASQPSDIGWSRFSRLAVVVMLLAAVASAGLTAVLQQRTNAGALHTVSAIITAPGATAAQLDQTATSASKLASNIRASVDARAGAIELRMITAQRQVGIDTLNQIAAKLLSQLPAPPELPASPASQPEALAIIDRLAQVRRQLAASTQPEPGAASEAAGLPDRWLALVKERAAALDSLKQLGSRAEPKPVSADAASITGEDIARSEAANTQLQTEIEALKTREDQLAGRLRVSVDAAAVQFQAMREALTAGDAYLQKLMQESHPEELAAQLKMVRDAVKSWDHSLTTIETQWRTQQAALKPPGTPDPLAVQAALEKSSRQFVTDVLAAHASFTKGLEAIGQGQDQTTKRLVLRNTLVKELSPLTTAEEGVLNATRAVILTDNVELTAIVQRFDALRRQVQQHKAQIATSLKQDRLNRLQQDQTTRAAKARHEQAGITARIGQIDAQLIKIGEQAVQLAASASGQNALLADRVRLGSRQAEEMQQLLALNEQFARQITGLPRPARATCIPARLLAGEPVGPTLATALLVGMAPIVLCSVGLCIAWFVLSSRRSHAAIEEYARSLKELSRRE